MEILRLAWQSNPNLLHSGRVCSTFHHLGSFMSPPYPLAHVTPCLSYQCRLLHSPLPPGIVSLLNGHLMLTITYTQGRSNDYVAHNLNRILVTATCVEGVGVA